MKIIKKLLSFLSIFLIFNSFNLHTSANTNEITVDEFKSQLCNMFYDNMNFETSSTINPENLPTNRIIVKTNSNNALTNDYGAISKIEGYKNLHVFQYSTAPEAQIAFDKFAADNVVYVEYDYYVAIKESSEITQEINQRPLSWNTDVAKVDEALEYLERMGVTLSETGVAVVDTGLYAEHSYFDSNRIIDSEYCLTFSEEISFSSMEDEVNHGTHVAGIIYDNTPNNIKISPYIAFPGSKITSFALIAAAIDAAVEENMDGDLNYIQVINLSVSSSTTKPNTTVEDSIKNAILNNIVVVVAAGNKSDDANLYTPGKYAQAITVAATDINNQPDKSYTNYGTCIDISAPGTGINSTVPRYYALEDDKDKYEPIPQSLFMEKKGTSMAAPLVSAAAALLKSINPDITPAEVERIIKETAYVPEGWDKAKYGEGIINFYNMVVAAVSEKPEFRFTADGKIKIVAPNNPDADIYYSLDYTVPTIEEKLVYSEPLVITDPSVKAITAVCHENGKLISEPVVYKLTQYFNLTVERFQTERPMSGGENMNITWRSFDPDIAKVDQNGNITGVSVGETQVYAIFDSGLRITYVVTVEPPWWQQLLRLLFFGFIWYRT